MSVMDFESLGRNKKNEKKRRRKTESSNLGNRIENRQVVLEHHMDFLFAETPRRT